MLIRIGFIVAIVAGLTVAGLNFTKVKEKIVALQTDLASEKTAKEQALGAQSKAEKAEKLAKTELESTKTELADTQTARDKAVTEAETQTKRAGRLSEDLTKSKGETADALAAMAAWTATGISADQVKPLIADLKSAKESNANLTEANKDLSFKIATLTNRIAKYEDPENYRVQLPPALRGKVLVADPKWDFVVLDFGAKSGALEDGVLLVNRNGRLVAKVQIRSVQPDRCIANVLPNWKLGDVVEGDQVIP
ncbi:MAG: hypothetical protein RL380_1787 [Verrucomicrobiota bacterium]|jgi:multidrug efflux pump subunit AcrA (membrane-fusion protein)